MSLSDDRFAEAVTRAILGVPLAIPQGGFRERDLGRERPRRILVLALGQLGDTVWLTPYLAGLRRRFPGVPLSVACFEYAAGILGGGDPALCDEVFVIPRGRLQEAVRQGAVGLPEAVLFVKTQAIGPLRERGFDLGLNPFGSIDGGLMLAAAGIGTAYGWNVLGPSGERDCVGNLATLLHLLRTHLPKELRFAFLKHRAEGYLDMLPDPDRSLPLRGPPIPEPDRQRLLAAAGIGGERPVVLHPGCNAAWRSKRWPPGHFIRLGRILHTCDRLPVAVAGAPFEAEAVGEIACGLASAGVPAARAVTETPAALRAVLGAARLLVCADSGPIHVAAMEGTPSICLSAWVPPEESGPLAPGSLAIQKELDCLDCWLKECPIGYVCTRAVPPEAAADAVRIALADGAPAPEVERFARDHPDLRLYRTDGPVRLDDFRPRLLACPTPVPYLHREIRTLCYLAAWEENGFEGLGRRLSALLERLPPTAADPLGRLLDRDLEMLHPWAADPVSVLPRPSADAVARAPLLVRPALEVARRIVHLARPPESFTPEERNHFLDRSGRFLAHMEQGLEIVREMFASKKKLDLRPL